MNGAARLINEASPTPTNLKIAKIIRGEKGNMKQQNIHESEHTTLKVF